MGGTSLRRYGTARVPEPSSVKLGASVGCSLSKGACPGVDMPSRRLTPWPKAHSERPWSLKGAVPGCRGTLPAARNPRKDRHGRTPRAGCGREDLHVERSAGLVTMVISRPSSPWIPNVGGRSGSNSRVMRRAGSRRIVGRKIRRSYLTPGVPGLSCRWNGTAQRNRQEARGRSSGRRNNSPSSPRSYGSAISRS